MKNNYFLLISILPMVFSSACSQVSPNVALTDTSSSRMVYYYMTVPVGDMTEPGSVVILQDNLILSPAFTNKTLVSDTENNLRTALEEMISDPGNDPVLGDLEIASLSVENGHADISLQGDIHAAGDIVLIAVKWMILLTVFSEPSVDTALITHNGKNIVNLGVSWSGNAESEGAVFSREEIDGFINENAYTGK